MNLTPHHTDSSWAWRWRDRRGEFEVAYVTERCRWLQRFRPADPTVTDVPWAPAQSIALPAVDTEDEARATVEKYAERKP